jgi:hypothetical protein
MHIWQKRGLRTLFSGAFLLALILGSGMSASAANAGGRADTFDPQPYYGWVFEHNGSYGAGGFEYNKGFAFSAPNNAWLATTSGWSAMGAHMGNTVPGEPDADDRCTASIYIKPAVNDSVTFNLEVFKSGSYEYIALKQVTVLKGSYKQVAISWIGEYESFRVRFSLLSNNGYYKKARLDHFYLYCEDL